MGLKIKVERQGTIVTDDDLSTGCGCFVVTLFLTVCMAVPAAIGFGVFCWTLRTLFGIELF